MLLPMLANAQTKVEIDNIWYNLDSEAEQAEVTFKGSSYYEYEDEYTGSITIPATVTHESVSYSVTSIGGYAFYDCESLTYITIPESVSSIGYDAFFGTAWYDNQPDGVVYLNKMLYKYKGTMPKNTTIEIKEGTIGIAANAFAYYDNLISIIIPEGVTSIGDGAFDNCDLTSITIPQSIKSIGDMAFFNCGHLTAVYISDIAVWCAIKLGNAWANPLYHANNLYLNGELVTELTIPENVTSIGEFSFVNCHSVTAINLPESINSIGRNAFNGCENLTTINIPKEATVTSIESYTFGECPNLTSINIPASVTSIGQAAFSEHKLQNIYCYAETVPDTDTDAFETYPYIYTTLYVPSNALEAYKATAPWSSFKKILALPDEDTGIDNAEFTTQNSQLTYDLSGRSTEKTGKGVYIVNGKKIVVK